MRDYRYLGFGFRVFSLLPSKDEPALRVEGLGFTMGLPIRSLVVGYLIRILNINRFRRNPKTLNPEPKTPEPLHAAELEPEKNRASKYGSPKAKRGGKLRISQRNAADTYQK